MSTRLLRVSLALGLAVAGVGAATDPPHTAAAAPAAASEAVPDARVTVAPASAGVLRPDQDLRVSVVVTNTGVDPLPEGSARLVLGGTALATSQELGAWLLPQEDAALPAGTRLGTERVPEVNRGSTGDAVEFTIPVDDLEFLRNSPRGSHPLWVEYRAGDGDTVVGRTSVVWAPSDAERAAGIAAAVPLTVPPTDTGLVDPIDLARYTGPSGILTRQLDAVAGRQVAIGIDPMILASIRVLGSAAPPSALDWLARLDAVENEIFALAYGDTDLAAVSQAGKGALAPQSFDFALDPALFPAAAPTAAPSGEATGEPAPEPTASPAETAAPTETPLPTPEPGEPDVPTTDELLAWDYTLEGIAWPAEGTVTSGDLDRFAQDGLPTTILGEENVRTAARAGQAHSRIGDHDVLTSDFLMSRLLRDATSARSTVEWESALAALGSALSVITTERGSTPPLTLATLDRTRPPAQPRIGQTLDALERLDWVDTTTVSALLDRPARGTRIVDRPVDEERIDAVRTLLRAHTAELDFATIALEPTDISAPRRLRTLGLLSQSWRSTPDAWFDEAAAFLQESGQLRDSVQLVESSQVNLLTEQERLPVSIGNSLDVPVTVYVNVSSQSPELVIRDNNVEVPVEPQSTARQFAIPVQSLANGTADIVVSLVSRTGEPIGEPTRLTVNVQAGWGTAASAVIGVLVVGLFAVGLFRTFGPRRRKRATGGADD